MNPAEATPQPTLTRQQRRIVDADGNFLVLACPGSGKTRAAAHRAARLITPPSRTRLAVCSYTNIGAQRLGSVLAAEHRVVLADRHFIGTVHGFLLRYVVYPFAHLLGAQRGPSIREGGWPDISVLGDNAKRLTIDQFRFRPDGTLVLTNKPRTIPDSDQDVIAAAQADVLRRKDRIFRASGAVTPDDAMWVALRLLRQHPRISSCVAGRFDELILDEAQDTSELQLACLEQLHDTGRLASLVLIGDLEQSIYSFQGASAQGCRDLAAASGLRQLVLDENHRSSQNICNVAVHFSSRDQADRAVGPHAACPIRPEVVLYPPAHPRQAVEMFRNRLEHHGIGPGSAAVLARSSAMVDQLNGVDSSLKLRPRAELLGRIAGRLATGTLTRRDVESVESLVAYCALDISHLDELSDAQRQAVRRGGFQLLNALPAPNGDLAQWMRCTAAALQSAAEGVASPVKHRGAQTLPTATAMQAREASTMFAADQTDPKAQTVHSIKGEECEAVMVVVRRAHAANPTPQLELWEAAADGSAVADEKQEERRVLFVALSRAQRFCLVAFPDDTRGRRVAGACLRLGFVRP